MSQKTIEQIEEELVFLRRDFFKKFDKLVLEISELQDLESSFSLSDDIEYDKIISIREKDEFRNAYQF